eukprot:evm.model.scf_51.16 EVM.evm.TU.scf_51.16   scf_51:158295-159754(+)
MRESSRLRCGRRGRGGCRRIGGGRRCWHVLRLAQADADVACGMDFVRAMGGLSKERQRLLMVEDVSSNLGFPLWLAESLSRWYWALKQWRRFWGKRPSFRGRYPLVFYDKWVSHDVDGDQFMGNPPYVGHKPSAARLRQGLPFPAHCCWNGLVVLNLEPFMHGVRFRGAMSGECQGSECFLMCNDFWRLGYRRVVVDPGVRVAYTYRDALDVYSPASVREVGLMPWGEARAGGPVGSFEASGSVECCALKAGKDIVDFEKDCYEFDMLGTNYTQLYLDG